MSAEPCPSRSWSRTLPSRAIRPDTILGFSPSRFRSGTPRLRVLLPLAIGVAALCASCTSSKGATSPAIESLTLTPTGWQTQAVVGETVVLETKVTDASGSPVSGISLSYASSDTTVLRVSQENATEASVTAVGPGTADLAVALASGTGGSASAASVSVQVTVDLAGVEIEGTGTPVVLTSVGDSAVVQARGLDVAGNTVAGGGLAWSVAGGGVASVTPYAGGDSAKVVAVGSGTDTLKVTAALCAKGCGATRVVEVKQAVARIAVSPDSAAVAAGDSVAFHATAYDASGAPVAGAPIRWTIGDRTLATADTSGVVHAWHTGVTQVTAFDDTVNAKATVDVVPGPATQLVFTSQPSDTSTGTALSPAVQVTEEDAYGNVATGATDSVTVALGANPGDATLAGATTEPTVAGVATFSDLSLNKAGSGYTLVARAGALPSATSAAFDIHDDAPTAAASSDTTPENTKLVMSAPGVLAGATDPNKKPLTAVLVTGPSHGTLVLNANGSFTYTPATNYIGSDAFTFEATDGTFTSAPATVSLDVSAPLPSLTSVASASGTASGGTGLTLTGTNLTGATGVTFGGVAATSVHVVNATTVTLVSPAHATGAVDVVISTPQGSATLSGGYTYLTTAVGQSSGGGVIAALGGGLDNLIAATADNSAAVQWGGYGTTTGAMSTTDGASNTATITAALGTGTTYAALVCANYQVDSQGNTPCQPGNACYNDWFLPAQDQLNALYTNRAAIGGFTTNMYWSSTEFSVNPSGSASAQLFSSGGQEGVSKPTALAVRCVRAFTP